MSGTRPFGGHHSASSLAALALACTIVSILLATAVSQKSVDCRKFVFAPTCRGIAAKRATLEAISRRESEDAEGSGKMSLGLPDFRGRQSDEEDSREEDKIEEDEEEEAQEGDEGEQEGRYEAARRATGGRRGGHNLGRNFKDRRFGRIRKAEPTLSFLTNRKVAMAPSTYNWLSNDKRRRRNRGLRRRLEYKNYDY